MCPLHTPPQEQIFESAFEHAAVGMTHTSLQGQWLRVNRKLCEITGYSREELLALSFQGITHPDDAAPSHALMQRLLSSNIASYEFEKRYLRKDGKTIWVQVQMSVVFTAQERASYIISVIQDISLRKLAELERAVSHQRYQALC
jgi:PAS domain S-box-containing protein